MHFKQKLIIFLICVILGITIYFVTIFVFRESPVFATQKVSTKIVEVPFEITKRSDANLVKDFTYLIPGAFGLKVGNQTLRPVFNQQEYSGTKVDLEAENLIKASFETFIDALKTDKQEDAVKFSAENIQNIPADNKSKLENLTLSTITFNKSGMKITEKANPVIPIGHITIKQGNCFNLEKSLTIKYNTWDKDYKFSEVSKFVDSLCSKYVPPTSPETATCTNCKYYPLDKLHKLTADYAPTIFAVTQIPGGASMNVQVKDDLLEMYAASRNAGVPFQITSGYRSYYLQINTFNAWVANELAQGYDRATAEKNASRYSALPGHSEHQLGNAMDVTAVNCGLLDATCPGNVKFFAWMRENSYKYGFVLSYPEGKESLTGYIYEPWHYRWIGKELAAEYHKYESQTYLAEFLRFKKLY